MICKNCQYYSYNENDELGHCEQGVNDGTDDTNYQIANGDVVEEDFGCNKFEDKK